MKLHREGVAMVLNNAHVASYLQHIGEWGWDDETLEADHWSALGVVAPIDAAMLLCRFNPNAESYDSAMLTTTDELAPEHLKRLAQRLADIDKADHRPRTLRDWHQTARGLGLTYHSWIDRYMEATTPPAPPEQATPKQPRNVPAVSTIEWEAVPLPESYRPPALPVAETAPPEPPEPQPETKEQRQDRRLKACIDDGLEMLTKAAMLRLPDGVGRLADIEGVKRQSFSVDVKAAQKRRANAVRDGGQ